MSDILDTIKETVTDLHKLGLISDADAKDILQPKKLTKAERKQRDYESAKGFGYAMCPRHDPPQYMLLKDGFARCPKCGAEHPSKEVRGQGIAYIGASTQADKW